MKLPFAICFAATLISGAAHAMPLEFPSSSAMVVEIIEDFGSFPLPLAGFTNGSIPTQITEGMIRHQAWHIPAASLTTLQLLVPLREQLLAARFEIGFECDTRSCGGFDFINAIAILPEPDMHVDFGDFRYLTAQRQAADQTEHISLLVSRSSTRGFVQAIRVGPRPAAEPVIVTSSKSPVLSGNRPEERANDAPSKAPLLARLRAEGHAVLEDLTFETGSSKLGPAEFESLSQLAQYLASNPDLAVVLVGHTDAEGSLSGNIALSKKRAAAVKARLTGDLGVPKSQVRAEGVGFLAPLTSNTTAQGRTENRRVEVVLSAPN
jgi:outer membrane protein OmpA-like peptidoglycan-associated protein